MASGPAYDMVQEVLRRFGLESMGDWAYQQIVDGKSESEIMQSMREHETYKTRFAGMQARFDNGYPAMSEEEYIQYENQATQMMRAYGLPEGFYDEPSDFTNFIGENLGLPELETRVQLGRQAAESAPASVRNELLDFYGVDMGGLTAFYLDPDRATDVLTRQYTAAEITAESKRFSTPGLDESLTMADAEDLVREGVDRDQAQQVYGALEHGKELLTGLAGERGAAEFGKEDVLGLLKNEADAARKFETVARSRVARHRGAGTGGHAMTREGRSSVGRAS